MMMNPVYGIFAWISQSFGVETYPTGYLRTLSMFVIIMVSWQWLPFVISGF